jgi:hypothetical protein
MVKVLPENVWNLDLTKVAANNRGPIIQFRKLWFGRAGVASHIGVQLGVPTIGVAKNLHLLAEEGEIFEKGELYRQRLVLLSKKVLIDHG